MAERGSNVILTPAEVEYYLRRFKKKTYTTVDCLPMNVRQANEIEVKYGLRLKKKDEE